MSMTIITPGKTVFPGHCKWCGCDFTYEPSDICDMRNSDLPSVSCPCCMKSVDHQGEHGTSEVPPATKSTCFGADWGDEPPKTLDMANVFAAHADRSQKEWEKLQESKNKPVSSGRDARDNLLRKLGGSCKP
jgi:hypothetical protein